MTHNDTPAEECERDAREYEESRRAAMTTCDYCEAPAVWRINSGETSLACDTCYREMFDENERASFTWEAERLTDDSPTPLSYRTACVGLRRRHCTNAARPNSAYCEECAPAFDALCAGCTPLHDADASAITETTLMNGNILIRHDRMTIFCGSAAVLSDLRAYLAQPLIEAAAERADDAIEAIEAMREAA